MKKKTLLVSALSVFLLALSACDVTVPSSSSSSSEIPASSSDVGPSSTSSLDPSSSSSSSSSSGSPVVPVSSVTLNEHNLELDVGDTFQLVPTVLPADATDKTVHYDVDHNTIVDVDFNTGLITALTPGVATVTASCSDKNDTCVVIVNDEVDTSFVITMDEAPLANHKVVGVAIKASLDQSDFDVVPVAVNGLKFTVDLGENPASKYSALNFVELNEGVTTFDPQRVEEDVYRISNTIKSADFKTGNSSWLFGAMISILSEEPIEMIKSGDSYVANNVHVTKDDLIEGCYNYGFKLEIFDYDNLDSASTGKDYFVSEEVDNYNPLKALKNGTFNFTITGSSLKVDLVEIDPEYTITFSAGDGSGSMEPVVMQAGTYVLPESTFTAPVGKQFEGWQVGNEAELQYPDDEIDIEGNVTITAIYEEIPVFVPCVWVSSDNWATQDSIDLEPGTSTGVYGKNIELKAGDSLFVQYAEDSYYHWSDLSILGTYCETCLVRSEDEEADNIDVKKDCEYIIYVNPESAQGKFIISSIYDQPDYVAFGVAGQAKDVSLTYDANIGAFVGLVTGAEGKQVGVKVGDVTYFSENDKMYLHNKTGELNNLKYEDEKYTIINVVNDAKVEVYLGENGAISVFLKNQTQNAYYLVGKINGVDEWTSTDYELKANPSKEGEYLLDIPIPLKAEDGIKAMNIKGYQYYPVGSGEEYSITEDGNYQIYFRPDGQGGEGWYKGYLYIEKQPEPSTDVYVLYKNGDTDHPIALTQDGNAFKASVNVTRGDYFTATKNDDPFALTAESYEGNNVKVLNEKLTVLTGENLAVNIWVHSDSTVWLNGYVQNEYFLTIGENAPVQLTMNEKPGQEYEYFVKGISVKAGDAISVMHDQQAFAISRKTGENNINTIELSIHNDCDSADVYLDVVGDGHPIWVSGYQEIPVTYTYYIEKIHGEEVSAKIPLVKSSAEDITASGADDQYEYEYASLVGGDYIKFYYSTDAGSTYSQFGNIITIENGQNLNYTTEAGKFVIIADRGSATKLYLKITGESYSVRLDGYQKVIKLYIGDTEINMNDVVAPGNEYTGTIVSASNQDPWRFEIDRSPVNIQAKAGAGNNVVTDAGITKLIRDVANEDVYISTDGDIWCCGYYDLYELYVNDSENPVVVSKAGTAKLTADKNDNIKVYKNGELDNTIGIAPDEENAFECTENPGQFLVLNDLVAGAYPNVIISNGNLYAEGVRNFTIKVGAAEPVQFADPQVVEDLPTFSYLIPANTPAGTEIVLALNGEALNSGISLASGAQNLRIDANGRIYVLVDIDADGETLSLARTSVAYRAYAISLGGYNCEYYITVAGNIVPLVKDGNQYVADDVEVAADDVVAIYHHGEPATSIVADASTGNNLSEKMKIIVPGTVDIYVKPESNNVWVTGYAFVSVGANSYELAWDGEENCYKVNISAASKDAVIAVNVGGVDYTEKVADQANNNVRVKNDVLKVITEITSSQVLKVYISTDAYVFLGGYQVSYGIVVTRSETPLAPIYLEWSQSDNAYKGTYTFVEGDVLSAVKDDEPIALVNNPGDGNNIGNNLTITVGGSNIPMYFHVTTVEEVTTYDLYVYKPLYVVTINEVNYTMTINTLDSNVYEANIASVTKNQPISFSFNGAPIEGIGLDTKLGGTNNIIDNEGYKVFKTADNVTISINKETKKVWLTGYYVEYAVNGTPLEAKYEEEAFKEWGVNLAGLADNAVLTFTKDGGSYVPTPEESTYNNVKVDEELLKVITGGDVYVALKANGQFWVTGYARVTVGANTYDLSVDTVKNEYYVQLPSVKAGDVITAKINGTSFGPLTASDGENNVIVSDSKLVVRQDASNMSIYIHSDKTVWLDGYVAPLADVIEYYFSTDIVPSGEGEKIFVHSWSAAGSRTSYVKDGKVGVIVNATGFLVGVSTEGVEQNAYPSSENASYKTADVTAFNGDTIIYGYDSGYYVYTSWQSNTSIYNNLVGYKNKGQENYTGLECDDSLEWVKSVPYKQYTYVNNSITDGDTVTIGALIDETYTPIVSNISFENDVSTKMALANGVVTFSFNGSATLYIKIGKNQSLIYATYEESVDPEKMSINKTAVDVVIGTPDSTVVASNWAGELTVSSNHEDIATAAVNTSTGVVTISGVAAGSAVITVSDGTTNKTVDVAVTASVVKYAVTFRVYMPNDEAKVSLVGSFSEWQVNPVAMQNKADTNLWTATVELEAGDYEFQFVTYDNEDKIVWGDVGNRSFTVSEAATTEVYWYGSKAAYYVVGSLNSWTESDEYKLALGENGVYTLDLKGVKAEDTLKVKSDGNWYSNTVTWANCGFTINDNIVVTDAGDYTVCFYLRNSSAPIGLDNGSSVTPRGKIDRYLRGTQSGSDWGAHSNYQFSVTENNFGELLGVQINAGDKFKVADSDWKNEINYYGIDGSAASNFEADGTNIKCKEKQGGKYNFFISGGKLYIEPYNE